MGYSSLVGSIAIIYSHSEQQISVQDWRLTKAFHLRGENTRKGKVTVQGRMQAGVIWASLLIQQFAGISSLVRKANSLIRLSNKVLYHHTYKLAIVFYIELKCCSSPLHPIRTRQWEMTMWLNVAELITNRDCHIIKFSITERGVLSQICTDSLTFRPQEKEEMSKRKSLQSRVRNWKSFSLVWRLF